MRIYLQTPAAPDQPPRYYHLFIQEDLLGGWNLIKEWGFQGASGRMVSSHYDTWDEAEAALTSSRDAQLARGYRLMFAQGSAPPKQGN